MTHVHIDEGLCIGSGNCTHFATGVFSLNEEGIAIAAATQISPSDEEAVRVAASQCPTGAISLEPADPSGN